jgi:hypothetical protein
MTATKAAPDPQTFTEVRYTDIEPNPLNPRRIFDKLKLDVLEESVRANKILVPLTAYRDSRTHKLYILDGERRWRCAVRIETGEVSAYLRSPPKDFAIPSDLRGQLVYDEATRVLTHRRPVDDERERELLELFVSDEWKSAVAELAKASVERPPKKVLIPVNIVDPPTPAANMLYMFHVHNLREQWDLMPTALSLRILMKELKVEDDSKLAELTQLSEPNVKRCKVLLSFPERYQQMMLDADPRRRLKANLFIEMYPVLDFYGEIRKELSQRRTRDQLTDLFIQKYRDGAIASVIHFRKILEARDILGETERQDEIIRAADRLVTDKKSTIKTLFDPLTAEERQVNDATELCRDFVKTLRGLKVRHATKRKALVQALKIVRSEINQLLDSLSGEE